MADKPLEGLRVAVLVANEGVEQVEMTEPMRAVTEAGATASIVAPEAGEVQGFNHLDRADTFTVDHTLAKARPEDYDALILPGGVANPDHLRTVPEAVSFARAFVDAGKPIGVICHGPWTLVEGGAVAGRTLNSWPSLKTDIRNAGGTWVDEEVHVDRGIVSSRNPGDLPAFCAKIVEEFAEGRHERRPVGAASRSA
ncbi:MAG TPA: type 1 glutamine amidotransferase domain-containing protein [Miltoncostaeaceae bacterium]|nr:type 1 glutamine amidotransferase domain-containing protein [Miltoncostaeaceae bacterium]